MVVKIRLARFGRARQPIYNIVVAQARSARNSKPMEVLGTYDPLPRTPLASNDIVPVTGEEEHLNIEVEQEGSKKEASSATSSAVPPKPKRYKDIVLDTSRTKYWLGVGAQPSEPVERLLCLIGLMEPKPRKTSQQTNSST